MDDELIKLNFFSLVKFFYKIKMKQFFYNTLFLLYLNSICLLVLPGILQADETVLETPKAISFSTSTNETDVNVKIDQAFISIQKLIDVVCKHFPEEELCDNLQLDETFTNSIGMSFVLIPPGSFIMGSPYCEIGRFEDEIQHAVTITQPYYLQTTEVTQGQWKSIMENNPSHFSHCGDNCPVENISWDDVQLFIQKLNLKEGTTKYALPTEAQWEYAARAGTTTSLPNGNLTQIDCGMDINLNAIGWYCGNADKPYQVAQKQHNAWSLYDMHANVFEWCQDFYRPYVSNSETNNVDSPKDTNRILRGGSWYSGAKFCRSACRYSAGPDMRHKNVGFRVMKISYKYDPFLIAEQEKWDINNDGQIGLEEAINALSLSAGIKK